MKVRRERDPVLIGQSKVENHDINGFGLQDPAAGRRILRLEDLETGAEQRKDQRPALQGLILYDQDPHHLDKKSP
jgi:hypothetical protein